MILASSSRHSTGKLSDTGEDREIAKPNKGKAIDEASWSATVNVRNSAWSPRFVTTHFWNPIAKMLLMSAGNCARC
jgi:hypothetical protein